MSVPDWVLLAAVLAVAGWWIISPSRGRRWLILAPAGLLALAALQVAVEGIYWEFFPAYALTAVLGALSLTRRQAKRPSGLVKWVGWAGIAAAMMAAIAPFALFLPVPELARPNGPYGVGTKIFRLVDGLREETATADKSDRRNVIAQAWYPAAAASGKHSTYIDGLGHLPPTVSLLPGFVMETYGRVDTHGAVDAPVSDAQALWPVIVFSPGFGAPRAAYTGLIADLASRGYIVIALDHPYESPVTELADGRIAVAIDTFPANAADGEAWMAGQLDLRVADVRFVIDQLGHMGELSRHLDPQRISAIGHSFGGATAAITMARDPRVKAAANIDGTLYGDVARVRLQHPFMLLQSDYAETGHGEAFLSRNKTLIGNLAAGGYRYEIRRANHYSFTDAPLFLAPPGRFALEQVIGGGRGSVETQRATADMLDAFLHEAMSGEAAGAVERAAAGYRDITGGRAP